MTSRARIALTALGLTLGILVLFVGTVWVLMATVSEDGLPTGGAKVAVVEIEGIILDGGQAVRDLREHGDNPSVKAVVVRINSPGGVVAPTQEIFSAIQRLRKGGKPVVASLAAGACAQDGGRARRLRGRHRRGGQAGQHPGPPQDRLSAPQVLLSRSDGESPGPGWRRWPAPARPLGHPYPPLPHAVAVNPCSA